MSPSLASITLLLTLAMTLALACVTSGSASAGEPPATAPTYQEDLEFLKKHMPILELSDDKGGHVLICPEYQGRVMTSTCGGRQGPSFGWINRSFIESGKSDKVFNNYGGEDRFWLAPEGGQFALWFAPGAKQELENWLTPPALHEGPFQYATTRSPRPELRRSMELVNASGTRFTLDVTRTFKLYHEENFADSFGEEAASLLRNKSVEWVGFATDNVVTNRGAKMSTDSGLVSIWTLGQFRPGEQTYVIVPYRAGDEATLGPIVTSDYFGSVPPERLKVTDSAILFHGDGQFRSKLGVSPRRARPVLGSIDFQAGVLTLVHYTLPADPAAELYINNLWDLPQAEPFRGDAANSYNDGPPEPGTKSLGGFYELETLSPAQPLDKGESLRHVHETFHVRADAETLQALARAVLGVDLSEVRAAFAQP